MQYICNAYVHKHIYIHVYKSAIDALWSNILRHTYRQDHHTFVYVLVIHFFQIQTEAKERIAGQGDISVKRLALTELPCQRDDKI